VVTKFRGRFDGGQGRKEPTMSRTILFIHGAWLTPASWTPFKGEFESRGFNCVAPAWPSMDRPFDELRGNPAPELKRLGIGEIADHYAAIAQTLDEPPILIGHSFGGLMVQLLLDRGIGVAGVAVDPAAPRGVLARPQAVITSFSIFRTWRGWRKVHTMSEAAFNKGFGNEMPPAEQQEAYRTQIVPAPGRIFFEAAFGIAAKVDFDNPKRPPLLFTAGEKDRTVPVGMIKDNYKKASKAPSPTAYREYPGRGHFLLRQEGWQEIAYEALGWLREVGAAPAAEPGEPVPIRRAPAA
jgi:pimeloyl-ACP methyl ester carboxylesterase